MHVAWALLDIERAGSASDPARSQHSPHEHFRLSRGFVR
jgi:hypothetical protein